MDRRCVAPDVFGNLLAVKLSAANRQDRARVSGLVKKVQEVTGGTVEIACVDQDYSSEDTAQQAEQAGIKRKVVEHQEANRGVCAAATILGR
jgi:hypothetical protein